MRIDEREEKEREREGSLMEDDFSLDKMLKAAGIDLDLNSDGDEV